MKLIIIVIFRYDLPDILAPAIMPVTPLKRTPKTVEKKTGLPLLV